MSTQHVCTVDTRTSEAHGPAGREHEAKRIWRVEVKTKQARDWPQCKGIAGDDSFLILVDFEDKSDIERPDFYVLTFQDWRELCRAKMEIHKAEHPGCRIEMTDQSFLRYPDQTDKSGKAHEGTSVRAKDISEHRDKWDKIKAITAA